MPAKSVSQDDITCTLVPLREDIDQHLAQLLGDDEQDQVSQAMRDCTLAPGKRVRPLLLLMAARELGAPMHAGLDLACAVEMVHSASLVFDDLPCMDDAALRRGRPTVHRQYGEDIAMLAGIALLTRAFSVIAGAQNVDGQVRSRMVARLADAVGTQGLVKGQYRDLRDASARSASDISASNRLKTGVLFEATLDIAAMLAGANQSVRDELARFADELGQAFQLCDDLLDDSPTQGKDVGKDQGKTTLVSLLGKDAVRRELLSHLDRADAHLEAVFGEDCLISRFTRRLFEPACAPAPSFVASNA
ncbi:polyprenyl synthetase family protein [Halopseudomonas nanhaiensis]|nr:polyprenyl synthetase family protein [Halopseudomonas nanhaiensis]